MRLSRTIAFSLLLTTAGGCAVDPFRGEPPSAPPATSSGPGEGPVISPPPPIPEPGATDPVIDVPVPTPVPRERPRVAPATLGPASTALVTQAQAQRKRGDLPGATVSLERALRIEPNNPLLWIEMGRLRMDQRNYAQAESMGRKALSMSVGDNRTQSAAWLLVADALQARGENPQAEEARERSRALTQQ
jgi:hypothetical protein